MNIRSRRATSTCSAGGGAKANWSHRKLVALHGKDTTKADWIGDRRAQWRNVVHSSPATIAVKSRIAAKKASGVAVWGLSKDSPDPALTMAIIHGFSPDKVQQALTRRYQCNT